MEYHSSFVTFAPLSVPYRGVESLFAHGGLRLLRRVVLRGYLSSLVFVVVLLFFFFLVVLGTIHNLTRIVFLNWVVIRVYILGHVDLEGSRG